MLHAIYCSGVPTIGFYDVAVLIELSRVGLLCFKALMPVNAELDEAVDASGETVAFRIEPQVDRTIYRPEIGLSG